MKGDLSVSSFNFLLVHGFHNYTFQQLFYPSQALPNISLISMATTQHQHCTI